MRDDGVQPTTADRPRDLWRPVVVTAFGALVLLVLGTIGLTWLLTGQWVWDYQVPADGVAEPDFGLPGALRSMLLIVGGLGGIVALVVAYRRQKHLEMDAAGKREARRDEVAKEHAEKAAEREALRSFTERFGAAAAQLGSGAAVTRLAGVYAMAALADEWDDQQQQCIDVLCAYLRLPYTPEDNPTDAPVRTTTTLPRTEGGQEQTSIESRPGEREVRWTIIRVIRDHLTGDAPAWADRDFDFTGATFDGADFAYANFSGGTVTFDEAKFTGGDVTFAGAQFSGGTVTFNRARIFRETLTFSGAQFSGGRVAFRGAQFFSGTVSFLRAEFTGGTADFEFAKFTGGTVTFEYSKFFAGTVTFYYSEFRGGTVDFDHAEFSGTKFVWPDGSRGDRPLPVGGVS